MAETGLIPAIKRSNKWRESCTFRRSAVPKSCGSRRSGSPPPRLRRGSDPHPCARFRWIPGTLYLTRAGLPLRVREWIVLGDATPGWRKVCPYRTGHLSSYSDETERSSASSASRIGRRRILAGSSVAMPPNWDDNRISAVLRTTIQVVLSEMLAINVGSLRFSRRRVTYPRPSRTQVIST